MKKYAYLFVVLLFTFVLSCDKDKDDDPQGIIVGAFSLTSYQCCLLTSEEYEPLQIIYDFDGEGTVTVTIDVLLDDNSQLPIKTSGTYDYTESGTRIDLQGIEYDFVLIDEQLTLSDMPESDGPIILFDLITEDIE